MYFLISTALSRDLYVFMVITKGCDTESYLSMVNVFIAMYKGVDKRLMYNAPEVE